MSTFENLTSKIVEKVLPVPRLKRRDLGKADNLMMEEQALNRHQIQKVNLKSRYGREKKKIKSNSSRAKADERKECQKGSGGDESEHEYDDRVSLHADDDSELAGNLNNILGTNKESEDEDSDSGLKSLIQELDKDEEIGEKSIKILQILNIKFGKTLMLLKNSKQK